MQYNLDTISDGLRIIVNLEHDASPAGTFISGDAVDRNSLRIQQIDNLVLSMEPKKGEVITNTITGTTDSKLYAIINTVRQVHVADPIVSKKVGDKFGQPQAVQDFDPKRFLNLPIKIAGTDIVATITMYEKDRKEYTLYSDTTFPIKYVDFSDGTTTFMFNKVAEESNANAPLINKYSGLVEEPKIESSVFIERGVVNVFEPFTKLKKIKSLNEMTKFGFGYYKINKEGFNF